WGSAREHHWQTKPDGHLVLVKANADGSYAQDKDGNYIPDENGIPIPRAYAKNAEMIGSIIPLAAMAWASGGTSVAAIGLRGQKLARMGLFGVNAAMGGDAAYSEARASGGTHLEGVQALLTS